MSLLREKLQNIKSPFFIGITGDSGSGKTTFSNGIRRLIGKDLVQTINMDGYHKENRQEREISGHLPLDPLINNLELLKTHILELKNGKSVEIPIYNHKTGDFDTPVQMSPTPIIIIEGLHALYPAFLSLYDFTIYVDPSRDIKWKWKSMRDIKKRGHEVIPLVEEMRKREAAYKRWIDFQKTSATIVTKIKETTICELARYECALDVPKNCYKVELIIEPALSSLPSIPLPFDMSSIVDVKNPAFMLASVPSVYWGRKSIVVHIDGEISLNTVKALEKEIMDYTGILASEELEPPLEEYEMLSSTQFAQLIIAWRFLEQLSHFLK